MGGTRKGELDRSAVLFENILKDQGIYFALMFLADSDYNNKEIKEIAKRFKPIKKSDKSNKVVHGFNCLCPASFCCGDD